MFQNHKNRAYLFATVLAIATTLFVANRREVPVGVYLNNEQKNSIFRMFAADFKVNNGRDDSQRGILIGGSGPLLNLGEGFEIADPEINATLRRLADTKQLSQSQVLESLSDDDWRNRTLAWQCIYLTVPKEAFRPLDSAYDPLNDPHAPLVKTAISYVRREVAAIWQENGWRFNN
jgi:hypothetical protein